MTTPPLKPPSPSRAQLEANKQLEAHQVRSLGEAVAQLKERQSNHEFKVGQDTGAFARYAEVREKVDRETIERVDELTVGLAVIARAVGVSESMPPRMQNAMRTLPPAAQPTEPPLHRRATRGAQATYLVLALSVVELLKELAPAAKDFVALIARAIGG